jgi:hypothetical protein
MFLRLQPITTFAFSRGTKLNLFRLALRLEWPALIRWIRDGWTATGAVICCRFQWHAARTSSKFHIRKLNVSYPHVLTVTSKSVNISPSDQSLILCSLTIVLIILKKLSFYNLQPQSSGLLACPQFQVRRIASSVSLVADLSSSFTLTVSEKFAFLAFLKYSKIILLDSVYTSLEYKDQPVKAG